MDNTMYPLMTGSHAPLAERKMLQQTTDTLMGHRFSIVITLEDFKIAFGADADEQYPIVICNDYKEFFFAGLARKLLSESGETKLVFRVVKNNFTPRSSMWIQQLHLLADNRIKLHMILPYTEYQCARPTFTYSETYPKDRPPPVFRSIADLLKEEEKKGKKK